MAESEDFQALKNISTEVDNSQVEILISSHCMKAQAFLLDKLRKQAERQKEICKFLGSSNLKLETEIKLAEQEIKSLNIATETIKLGNIELHKEHLLSKERKAEIFERTEIGKKKYDNLWAISKKRYESIPIIQNLIEVKNKNQTLQTNINVFTNESKHLVNDIEIKKNNLDATDRARIIKLAEFITRERSEILTKINENTVKIKEVFNEVEVLKREGNKTSCNEFNDHVYVFPVDPKQVDGTIKEAIEDNKWTDIINTTGKDTLVLPKLHLQNIDLDILSVKFDQINNVDLQIIRSMKRAASSISSCSEENPRKIHKTEEGINDNCISSYFDISLNINASDKKIHNNNYSKKKLIHILEDIKITKDDTFEIIKKLEPAQFHTTELITSSKTINSYEIFPNTQDEIDKTEPYRTNKSLESQEIDEPALPKTSEENVVDPPSQFLDVSQISQEKKTVTFNIPNELPTSLEDMGGSKVIDIDKSQEQVLNISTASNESYSTIKDKILKQRNLDLSPQFVYSKSTVMNKQHMNNDEKKITSKFFESENEASPCNIINDNDNNKNIQKDQILTVDDYNLSIIHENENRSMGENNVVVSSPKGDTKESQVPVAGFLFNHGPQGIPDSLNVSMSTTGFEDSEDFPHYIDSSLLLSPKADIPAVEPSSNNNEVLSQEVPNFLAGLRKTGFSFFGSTTCADTKPDSYPQSQGSSFNFAFGNEEKKGRRGFFNMFH